MCLQIKENVETVTAVYDQKKKKSVAKANIMPKV